MRKHILAATNAAIALIPTLALAQETCEQRSSNRAAGTIIGAIGGALLGNAVSSHGGKTGGTIIGGVAGAADLTPKCPVICHLGRKDGHIPADEVCAKIKAAQPQVPVYIYENSGHGFNNDGRPDSDADDAKLARERTLALFEQNGAA